MLIFHVNRLSAIHMKYQALFPLKRANTYVFKLSSATVSNVAVKAN